MGLIWSGVKFSAFFEARIAPLLRAPVRIVSVVIRSQDGYRTLMLLEDLFAKDVLLADQLNGGPLTVQHGAPIRLVAPQHYSYKSIKYVASLEFHTSVPKIKTGLAAMMDHDGARVALEERGRWLPGWILRRLIAHSFGEQ
jgi:DMSO/TMAO reductase YedYZ molybdopterin-dependent catalytic subunit